MKVSFSPGIIPCGWLGSKCQLTNQQIVVVVLQAARKAFESAIFLQLAEDRREENLKEFKEAMTNASLQQYNYSYSDEEVWRIGETYS